MELAIPLEGGAVDSLGGLLDAPAEPTGDLAVLLAHGAGAPMESDFMTQVAGGLAAAGLPVLRFRYPYMERAHREGRRFPPDRGPRLEHAHLAALEVLRTRFPERRLLLAGKSMGGRISSLLAAEGVACAGLAFLGYPLHPQGKPERLRSAHFPSIEVPSLFLQGTRDGLCDLDLLRRELGAYGAPYELVVVEGADHSFQVLKRLGRSAEEVRADLVQSMLEWAHEAL